ncbi:hypothetical protein F441_17793 [Phytophthora nicotianae CJ01A1]|uniref:Uncharacterized protein n=2 Tax=Phytophthora nicotianae TaxID=4792 RepID=W2W7U2_PHYNI|nr:hypothetical protein L915_17447 [Phytophthora nicotianae]ETP05634.1 hypothetical protein F441_17793 [Phytophthora nicotianae CJ01A1]
MPSPQGRNRNCDERRGDEHALQDKDAQEPSSCECGEESMLMDATPIAAVPGTTTEQQAVSDDDEEELPTYSQDKGDS